MKVHVMNSAMMPIPGTYHCIRIDAESFRLSLINAHKKGQVQSWIGYPANLDIIEQLSGIRLPLVRENITGLEPGDTLLCMRLHYRVQGSKKGLPVTVDDFDFFAVNYAG